MKTKSLFELADEYKKGKFNPKEYRWEWETDPAGKYSIYITHKKNKNDFFIFDGAKNLDTIKAACKLFNTRPKEKK